MNISWSVHRPIRALQNKCFLSMENTRFPPSPVYGREMSTSQSLSTKTHKQSCLHIKYFGPQSISTFLLTWFPIELVTGAFWRTRDRNIFYIVYSLKTWKHFFFFLFTLSGEHHLSDKHRHKNATTPLRRLLSISQSSVFSTVYPDSPTLYPTLSFSL